MSDVEPSSVRAGNADRENVVARLNTAFAEGRLDVAELDERVAAAYRARTLGELVPLTADLPVPHEAAPGAPARRQTAAVPSRSDAARWAPVAGMTGILLLNVLIWGVIAVVGDDGPYFWPIWLLIPLGLSVLGALGRGHR